MTAEQPTRGRGGRRPGAGRPGSAVEVVSLRLPPAARRQLLALARQRRALTGDPKLSQTAVVCDLIAAAWSELDGALDASDDR